MTALSPLAKITPTKFARTTTLSRRQKAAIIVQFLLNEGSDVALNALPDNLQATLTQQLGEMRHVDRETLAKVLEEFSDELVSLGLTFPQGLAGALNVLDGRISPRTASQLRKQAGVRQSGDPWERLKQLEVKTLLPIIEVESTEVAAVVLSKIEVAKAAELLGLLPGEKARRITYAISLTEAVTPDAVDRIGFSLVSQLDARPERAFPDDPEKRVGAILNFSASGTRDDVLSGLDETDADFARRVRNSIFTFTDIPDRIAARDIPKLTREIDTQVLVTALAFASTGDAAATAEFILGNISKRMAENIREEMSEVGKIRNRDGEDALNQIVGDIRRLEEAGELELVQSDDEDGD